MNEKCRKKYAIDLESIVNRDKQRIWIKNVFNILYKPTL